KMTTEYLEDFSEPMIQGMVPIQPIVHRYVLSKENENIIRNTPYNFGFGGFSETVYYRTYSQLKIDGKKEKFPDTIIRVINGVASIRKNWYIGHGLYWDEKKWSEIFLN